MRRSVRELPGALPIGTAVIMVDGGSPRSTRRLLQRVAVEQDFALLRSERVLSPNAARNAALPFVDSEFVLFLDYETRVPPSIIEALEACARSQDAAVVGPLYMEQVGRTSRLHNAGANAHFEEHDGARHFVERHRNETAASSNQPTPTEQVEFHCMLVRKDVLDQQGGFDEELRSLRDHADLCIAVREAGGGVWVEPRASVSYVRPRVPTLPDIAFCLVRWSDAWNRASLDRFNEKWDVARDDPSAENAFVWARAHRRFCSRPYLSLVSRCFGSRRSAFYDWVDVRAQNWAMRWLGPRSVTSNEVSVVRWASWMARAQSEP
jgi:cellulose synthase/poly-beta-1,6-N-acetylglucosamine synthase-like glycosyltransferase